MDRGDITGGASNQTGSVLKNSLGQLATCPGNASHQRSFRLWRDSKLIAEVAFRFPTKPAVSLLGVITFGAG